MDTLVTIIIVICAVGVSAIIGRYVRVPLPLIQIALGALLALPRVGRGVELDPNIFLAAFVAPLLFTDAWQTSKREFARAWKTIVLLAFGLALVTVAGTGFFVHWLVPAIGIPSAFALAAALAPTDVVAVQSIARASPLPRRLMHIIEGEGLLNDATGLVALRFAVAAAMTGTFYPGKAALDLVITAAGGFLLGGVAAIVVFGLLQRLSTSGNSDGKAILVVLPFPTIVFVIAEHMHLSGILAAVAAGLAGEVISRRAADDQTMRLTTLATWSMLSTALNGAIFVLLGMQLPAILAAVPDVAHTLGLRHPLVLFGYVVGITWSLLVVRGLWVWFAIVLTRARAGQKLGEAPSRAVMSLLQRAITVSGVRGAVTLGAVFTIPLTLEDGTPFPGREVVVVLAAGVILWSLISSSLALPRIAKKLVPAVAHWDSHHREEQSARVKLARAAIDAVDDDVRHLSADAKEGQLALINEAAASVTATMLRIVTLSDIEEHSTENVRQALGFHHQLHTTAITARRAALVKMLRAHEIDDEIYRRLMHELDLRQASMPGVKL